MRFTVQRPTLKISTTDRERLCTSAWNRRYRGDGALDVDQWASAGGGCAHDGSPRALPLKVAPGVLLIVTDRRCSTCPLLHVAPPIAAQTARELRCSGVAGLALHPPDSGREGPVSPPACYRYNPGPAWRARLLAAPRGQRPEPPSRVGTRRVHQQPSGEVDRSLLGQGSTTVP